MTQQAKATIYLANERGCTQSDEHRSYHTLNFGTFFNPYKKAIANLTFLNDETLKQASTIQHCLKEDTLIILIPLVGGCAYKNNYGIEGFVDVGQSCYFKVDANTTFEISNPYQKELINYLCIGLTMNEKSARTNSVAFDFNLDVQVNSLIQLFSDRQTSTSNAPLIYLGKLAGREEGTYKLQDPEKGVFVFVVEGAFEVQNRLLQSRDGLFLRSMKEIEFEALSNDAIILVIDGLIS